MARYDLPDEAWDIIQPLLPAQPATPRAGRPRAEHRMIINGIFMVRKMNHRFKNFLTMNSSVNHEVMMGHRERYSNKMLFLTCF